jgi:hypothetical protein
MPLRLEPADALGLFLYFLYLLNFLYFPLQKGV